MTDLVETYGGGRLHERPQRFRWKGAWLLVEHIQARWREPGSLLFRVRAGDGQLYQLKYNRDTDAWEVRPHPHRGP
jgi:hypothetical protein